MRVPTFVMVSCGLAVITAASSAAQGAAPVVSNGLPPVTLAAAPPAAEDPIRNLVGRLDLERYKTTIRGLTQFGDRRQGTERNRRAVDWIEAQLKSYGCTNTERINYEYNNRQLRNDSTNRVDSIAGRGRGGRGGATRWRWWRRRASGRTGRRGR